MTQHGGRRQGEGDRAGPGRAGVPSLLNNYGYDDSGGGPVLCPFYLLPLSGPVRHKFAVPAAAAPPSIRSRYTRTSCNALLCDEMECRKSGSHLNKFASFGSARAYSVRS